MQVSLDFDIPVANAVLTVETEEQARTRLVEKGTDAARVAVEMGNISNEFDYDFEEEEEF